MAKRVAITEPARLRRLAWFVVLWVASVAALGIVAWLLRFLIRA